MSSTVTPSLPRIAQPWALKDLPPFRPVAMKLIRLAGSEIVTIRQVEALLKTDAAFTAEVLRFANSALVGSRAEIFTVGRAVETVGLERIRALAMTIALRDFFPVGSGRGFLQLCWRYNLATAIICEWLAPFLPLAPDACYTAGLVHDIGRLAILRSFPQEYERALADIEDHRFDLLQCEKSVFEMDHCEAGLWLMDRWEFPAQLSEVAALHHREPTADTPALVAAVYIAWQMADMLGLSPMATRSAATIEEITATLPEPARQGIFAGLDDLPGMVAEKLNTAESVAA
jgi:HD-like signal output (HDOD) protein